MNDVSENAFFEKLGIVIYEERTEKKMSQAELAKASGLNRSYISDIETGSRNPTLKALLQLSKGLDTPLSVFVLRVEFMLKEGN